MAKKKAVKAKAKGKPAPKAKTKVKPAKLKAVPKARPRSQVLPGMEQVRNRVLDNICEGISEVRAALASARSEEASLQQAGLREMQAKKVTAYRHSGVEVLLVPGDVHLRVRTLREKTNSDGGVTEAPAPAADVAEVLEDEHTIGDDMADVLDREEVEA